MDIQMPVMDGYEAAKEIRKFEEKNKIPEQYRSVIIAITGHNTESYKKKCFRSGMNKFCIIFILLML